MLVLNQFAPNGQKLTVWKPEFLAVPSQKRDADGLPTNLDFPKELDHFKCYTVAGDFQPVPVQLQDQFDRMDGGPASFQDARVLRPRYLCNPVDKFHFLGFDPAGDPMWNTVRVQHPEQHLVCYDIKTKKQKPHSVLIGNQFGEKQKLLTKKPRLLCVPSEKRVPKPNEDVIDGFNELRSHIGDIPGEILNQDQKTVLIAQMDQAQGDYEVGNLCGAQRSMHTYLKEAQALRRHGMSNPPDEHLVVVAEDLFNRGHSLGLSFFARIRCGRMDPLGVPIFLKLLEIPNLCPTQLSPQWPSPAMTSLATSRAWVFSRVRFIVAGLSTGSTLPSTRIIPLSTSRPGFRVR